MGHHQQQTEKICAIIIVTSCCVCCVLSSHTACRCSQVAKAAFDASTSKWVLEGAVRRPVQQIQDLKSQPPITPWNLGVFDALVLADKMTGCPGMYSFVIYVCMCVCIQPAVLFACSRWLAAMPRLCFPCTVRF